MSESKYIQQQLEVLDQQSHELLSSISDLKYRHGSEGNRRTIQERRSGHDRRGINLSPARAAGRRSTNRDRRIPLRTRHESLSTQLAAVVAQSLDLQNWRQSLANAGPA